MSYIRKLVLYPLEFLIIAFIYGLFWLLPLQVSSWLGGRLGRLVGPHLKVSRLGMENLQAAFPKKSPEACAKILKGMWEHLGRVAGEFPHLAKIIQSTEVVNLEVLKNLDSAAILFAGHLGNWELPHWISINETIPISLISRPPTNPLTRWLFGIIRKHPLVGIIIKGAEGTREMMRVLQNKGHIGILIDQRISDGAPIPFFGRDALTALGPAKLAYKYDALLVPVQVERIGQKPAFKVTFHKPFKATKDPVQTTKKINACLEDWIRENPEQWLWVHKRWKL
jgi:Kdo2-lipid IVA lauroyltransferase/acyltransferase